MTKGERNRQGIEREADDLNNNLLEAFHKSCPENKIKIKRNVRWWNRELETMRKNVRKLYNISKRTGKRDSYLKSLTDYNKMIREAKRKSWRE